MHIGYRRRKPHGRDANGSWIARRYTGDGAYETEVFAEADDFSEADRASILTYEQAIAKLGVELSEVQKRTRYTVRNAIDDYIASLKLNAATAQETEGMLKHYLIGFLGADGTDGANRVLSQLTRDDFARWPAWALANPPLGRRKKRAKPAKLSADEAEEVLRRRKERVNRMLNNFLACLNFAHENERVPTDDAWSKLKRFKGTEQARIRWLELDECRRLTNACATDFRNTTRGGLLTGARWSELRRVRVGDYDNNAGTVLIAKTKRKKSRYVYLTDEGKRAFTEWTAGRDRDELVFTRASGEPWGSHDQHRPMAEARAAAGLDDEVTFHVLRHTYASMLVKAGVHLSIVAQSLGHADTRMVEKHYGHLAPSHAAQAIRANLPTFGAEVAGNVAEVAPVNKVIEGNASLGNS
ncbi:MAG: phage integrase [Gammaproteobacteria bacterium]|nr:phage integrase [Gammaproteobacteria bacterium]